MIKLIDFYKSIQARIKESLKDTEFDGITPTATDVIESIVRPAIKVIIESSTNGKFNYSCSEKTLTCRIYFFTKDKNKYAIDNLKMQDILEIAFFNDLEVKEGFFVPVESVNSEVTDGVLVCSFDLYYIEELEDSDINEIIETLSINLGEEE